MQAARRAALTEPEPPSAAPAEGTTGARPRRRTLLLAAVAAGVLALDITTKSLVVAELEGRRSLSLLGGRLLIRVSRNPGAAFSFAEGATLLFTAVAIAVVVTIVRVSRRLQSTGWAISLGLLLGGATGNLLDRLLRAPGVGRGAVVDFIDFIVYPSFNVADSSIVTGGILAVLLSLRGVEMDGSRQTTDTAQPETAEPDTVQPDTAPPHPPRPDDA